VQEFSKLIKSIKNVMYMSFMYCVLETQ